MMKERNSKFADANLVTLLRHRAELTPDGCAYVFLVDGEYREQSITYRELDARARMIAGYLQAHHKAGERALLLYPSGLDYIAAFFGCLYANIVAVPVYPPSRHYQQRLEAIIQDAAPTVILTTTEWRDKLQRDDQASWRKSRFSWLDIDRINCGDTPAWIPHQLERDSLAFLQYTSGSTGNPKGVMVSHGNLMANQRVIRESFQHSKDTIVVGWLPFYHDMGLIGNILQPLYLGTAAILMSPMSFLEKPIRWLNTISKYRATTSGGPNFAYELCVRKITPEQLNTIDLSCWTLAFNGSEPVRAATLDRFASAFSSCGFRKKAFFPCYGLAEATLFVTGRANMSEPCTKSTASSMDNQSDQVTLPTVSCGYAAANHQVRIVDPKTGVLCPNGTEGEIWVSGPSVAQGYWNQPVVSEETFHASLAVPKHDAVSKVDHKRYLRTGDLGMLKRGNLHVTGRMKDLIILRGQNYYPHDFEQALENSVADLRSGCSAAFSISNELEEILVIVAEAKRKNLSVAKTREILSAMRQVLAQTSDVPIGVLVLAPPGAVPKTSSGKIQRQACKEIYLRQRIPILAQSGEHAVIPNLTDVAYDGKAIEALRGVLYQSTQMQRVGLITTFIRTHLAQHLRITEYLSADTPIRSLGLDSLQIVELKHAVDALLENDTALALFWSDHSIRKLAEALACNDNQERISSIVDTDSDSRQKSVLVASTRAELSYAQKAIWMVYSLEARSISNNVHFALQLEGFLKPDMVRQAFDRLRAQHEQLRACYRMIDDVVVQMPLSPGEWPEYFAAVDASAWTEADIQSDLAQRISRPFDLVNGNLLHITCYNLNEQRHILLFCAHHIAVDLRSAMILLNDLKSILSDLTSGKESYNPELTAAASYRDFVTWQQNYLQSSACETNWRYWQKQLVGTLPVLALPVDFSRPPVPVYRGASHALQLDLQLTEKLKHLGRQYGATLFMILLAMYKVLLYRYTHQQDLIVGTASSGRPQARFMNVVGNFVNPIALRSYPEPTLTFVAYLQQIRDVVSTGLSHADYPFSLLVEQLQPERSADHWPVYQTWFGLQQDLTVNEESAYLTLGQEGESQTWNQWQLAPKFIHEQIENFDLRLMAAENKAGMLLAFKYRSDLFQAQTIARMAGHFQELVNRITAEPEIRLGELSLLTHTEWTRQIKQWNTAAVAFPKKQRLHSLFEAQVKEKPNQTAVSCDGVVLTYAELDTRANQLAHYLRELGVGPEMAVGLCVARSLDMLVGILGILKAGGAYVPIDPNFPVERVTAMITDAAVIALVTHQNLMHHTLPSSVKIVHLDRDSEAIAIRPNVGLCDISIADHLAYMIYTSGSTGKPKGVAVTHANIVHSTLARSHYYQDEIEGFLLLSSYTFDSSMAGLFWTLNKGGCVFIPPEGSEKDPQILGKLLSAEKITHLLCLPSFYAVLLDYIPLKYFSQLKTIIVAGEACPSKIAAHHYFNLPHVALFNEYGPTEGTVWSSVYQLQAEDEDRVIPIGKPISNVQIYLLDKDLNPVPIGVTGELFLGGSGLARGYHGQGALTAERFIPHPFGEQSGERLYRTGDLARYRKDGNIEYLDRVDYQVKIRGFRVELSEVEAALLRLPRIKAAVVLVHGDSQEKRQLTAYLVIDGSELVLKDIQRQLKHQLPDYMIPTAFVVLDEIPLGSNGKVNRKALPDPEGEGASIQKKLIQPRNSVEKTLMDIWMGVLSTRKPFGIHDDFFDLGGHSLAAIQMMVRVQDGFNVELPIAKIYQAPTIAELANLILQQQTDHLDEALLESLLDELEQLPNNDIHHA